MKLGAFTVVLRVLLISILTLLMMGAGLAGLCGGLFTVLGVMGPKAGEAGQEWNFMSIAVLSLLIGGGVAVACGLLLARLLRDDV